RWVLVQDRMSLLLLAALWVHLLSCVLLVGAFFTLLLAGPTVRTIARRWEVAVVARSRMLVLAAIGSGIVWLLVRTAVFEGRSQAALEPRAVWHAVLDTRPGLVWLARHGLLIVLAAFLSIRLGVAETRNWIAARGEALVLSTLALALVGGSSHAAAVAELTRLSIVSDVAHLLATGVWMGGLGLLALLLRAASRERVASRDEEADGHCHAAVVARRFSRFALVAMIVLTTSGVVNAIVQVESMAGLVGTTHGRLLLAKLAVLVPILVLAVVNRTHVLPALSDPRLFRRLAAFVALEALLALVLLGLAAAMTLTTPARHAPPVWPLPFRFSLDALLDGPAMRWRALLGGQL